MELKSLSYIAFIAIFFVLYFAAGKIKNAQKYVILATNIFFILVTSGKKSLIIILLCSGLSFLFGHLVEKQMENKNKKKAQALTWTYVVLAVAILCYFKFFKETYLVLQNALSAQGIQLGDLVSPIGVSYFTLTMLAYINDIYHKKHKAEKNIIDYIMFITFFPSILQGPINFYKKTMPQLKETHPFDADRFYKGLQRMLWGYIKKAVIADRIGLLVIAILKDDTSSGFLLLWTMVLYSFQIYADFSGGIDAIMGVVEVMDIKLIENFDSPLISKSVTEYWQRWHKSLGEFMEKYIYYPIVLHRGVMKFSKKIPNKYLQKVFSATLASILVFVIVGIWHGTGWNYVVYGCYQALFVSSAVLLGPVYKSVKTKIHLDETAISWRLFQIIRTFMFLTIGRYFIRAKDLPQAFDLLGRTFGKFKLSGVSILFDGTLTGYGMDAKNITLMYIGIIVLIIVDVVHANKIHIRETIMKQDIVFRFTVYFAAIFTIIIFGVYGLGFDGASFIYQGF